MTAAFDRPRARRHAHYSRPEVREAYRVLRSHQRSNGTPPACTADGCGEPYPCPPVRNAEDVLKTA